MHGNRRRQRGVSLIEMAIVLLILGILTRVAVQPWSAAIAHRQYRQANHELDTIREAIWAHVVSRGVLPCPLAIGHVISDSSKGCLVRDGKVPAVALGLPGAIDDDGALLDPWGHPYRLAVSGTDGGTGERLPGSDWNTPGESARIGLQNLQAGLVVCGEAVTARCPESLLRASEVAFVLFSTGADVSSTGAQRENLDGDSVFVLQAASVNPASPFDDLLSWGSASETIYWLLRAGWLP